MPMTMKDACERCETPLPHEADAFVCSYECTFCPSCTASMLAVCPNCGGELLRRPRRRPKGETDALGANATAINIPEGSGTTTIESKTNFFAAGTGKLLRAETTPLHRGKTTHVWQTRITDETGRLVAQVTQTQMVLPRR